MKSDGKNKENAAVKRSVSAPRELWRKADKRRREKMIATFSQYLQGLMRADIEHRKAA